MKPSVDQDSTRLRCKNDLTTRLASQNCLDDIKDYPTVTALPDIYLTYVTLSLRGNIARPSWMAHKYGS